MKEKQQKVEIKNKEQRDLYNKFMLDIINEKELLDYLKDELKLTNEEIIDNFKYLFMIVPTLYKKINISIRVTNIDDYLTDMLTVDNDGNVVTVKNTILPKYMGLAMDERAIKLGKKAVSLLDRASFLMDEIGYIKVPAVDFCTLIEKHKSEETTITITYYRRNKELEHDVVFNYVLDNMKVGE